MQKAAFLLGMMIASVGLSACGPAKERADVRADISDDPHHRFPTVGELGKTLDGVIASEWSEECDRSQELMSRELTQALDLRAELIKKYIETAAKEPATSSKPASYKLIPFGKSYIREYVKPDSVEDRWSTENTEYSWSDAYRYYLKIKDQPVNKHWVNLSAEVRSLLMDDESRVIDGSNLELRHDSEEAVASLLKTVTQCDGNEACTGLNLKPTDLEFAKGNEIFRFYMNKIEDSSVSATEKRNYISRFVKRLQFDHSRFAMRTNETITVKASEGKLKLDLPVDGSEFDSEQRRITQEIVEKTWTNDEFHLSLTWHDSIAGIFKIIFDVNKPGERSGVWFRDKKIELYPLTGVTSIAHEFGHVLGFKDRYYLLWNAKSCSYMSEGNDADIMSNSRAGSVRADEWKILKDTYSKLAK